MSLVGFEPTSLTTEGLESSPLDHSGTMTLLCFSVTQIAPRGGTQHCNSYVTGGV